MKGYFGVSGSDDSPDVKTAPLATPPVRPLSNLPPTDLLYRGLNNYLYYLGVPFMKGVYTDYYKGYYRGLVYRGLDKYQYYFGGSLLSL